MGAQKIGLVCYCCITNHHKLSSLKFIYLSYLLSQHFCKSKVQVQQISASSNRSLPRFCVGLNQGISGTLLLYQDPPGKGGYGSFCSRFSRLLCGLCQGPLPTQDSVQGARIKSPFTKSRMISKHSVLLSLPQTPGERSYSGLGLGQPASSSILPYLMFMELIVPPRLLKHKSQASVTTKHFFLHSLSSPEAVNATG